MAPNVLTFSGFLLTVLNFFLLAYYDPTFNASSEHKSADVPDVPKWVFLLSAINLFVAHTLGEKIWFFAMDCMLQMAGNLWSIDISDGIDGKQARRTGTSGPLGELFDHGLDSWSAAFIPIVLYSAFGCGYLSTLRMYFVIWNVFINFYTAHWEKYNTGILFLPLGYDAAMLVSTCVVQQISQYSNPLTISIFLFFFREWSSCWAWLAFLATRCGIFPYGQALLPVIFLR